MREELQIYIAYIIFVPIFVSYILIHLELISMDLLAIVYFLALISTHLVGSKIQDMLR